MINMIDEIILDDKRCNEIVITLNKYFENKNDIADIEYPTDIKYNSNEYFIYMFYSCLLDYGMRSKIYHKNLLNTYETYQKIFNPNYVINMKESTLKEIIVNYVHPRYPNIAVKKWIELSQELVKYNDISEKLKSINSFEKLDFFIKNIKGYGQKTGGLLIRIICDSGVCNFKNHVESIPIDRHDIEISYLTGIISDKKVTARNIKKLSDMYVKISRELNISPIDIDKYLWEVGNSFCNKKKCNECPLSNYCNEKKKV